MTGSIALKFLTGSGTNEHIVAVPYGSARRSESKADLPMGEWIATDSLTIFADHIFAYNMTGNKLGLTALRSPIYGDLRIRGIDPDTDYEIMEQGINEGRIRVFIGGGCDAVPLAAGFSNPPIVLCETNHQGNMASSGSFLSVGAESVMLTVLKKSEDGDSLIVRGVEYSGKAQKITLNLKGKSYRLEVAPYDIFTAKIDGERIRKVDMLEEDSAI